jgi:signal transduction histidine kinase/CheY-like chemotaxis protein
MDRAPTPGWRRAVLVGAGVLLAILVPIALWGAVVRETVVSDIARRGEADRLQAARLAAATIALTLGEVERRLDLAASVPSVRDALAAGDAHELERHLADLRRGTAYATTLALDASGKLVARDPPARESYGQSFADRDYFVGASVSATAYVSEAVVSRISGEVLVVVAHAVRDQRASQGMLLITLAPSRMFELLLPLRATPGRELHLVDQRSRVIASTAGALASLSELPVTAGERVETVVAVERSAWRLVVSDDASVALATQRRLEGELAVGGVTVVGLALACSAAMALLFAKTLRQRAQLAAREAALAGANMDLVAASRHKSEFLAGMSHELRTPLNAILGFSDLLAEQLAGRISDRQGRYLRNIRDAGTHLLGLINDVLDLAKVEAGRVELRPERTTLGELVKPLLASTSAAAEVHALAFETDVEEEAALTVDVVRMRQILYNLLSNAVKFTAQGRIALRAKTLGPDLEIEVSDTGIGIPDGSHDRVFGTFERLHEGRHEASGTGLGLALTKQLVELQGGTIAFSSVEGKGTTFHVRIPSVVSRERHGERVLVVEDDPRDAELVVAVAARAGLEAEVVSTPAQALESMRRSPPVAIVLDLQLAEERGERLLEGMRSRAGFDGIPVIVVTVEDDSGRTAALGADALLTRPIRPAVLTEHLVRACRGRKEVARADPAGR